LLSEDEGDVVSGVSLRQQGEPEKTQRSFTEVKKVRFTKLAWREVNAAAKFFEGRKEGLGLQFYDRVDEAAD